MHALKFQVGIVSRNVILKLIMNCEGTHLTMASLASKRKNIKRKRIDEKNREQKKVKMTHAKVAEKTIEIVNQQTENTQTMLENICRAPIYHQDHGCTHLQYQ